MPLKVVAPVLGVMAHKTPHLGGGTGQLSREMEGVDHDDDGPGTSCEEWVDDIDYSSLDWDAVVEQGRQSLALKQTLEEQLWSGKTRGFFEFEPIAPMEGLPMGAVGVAVGSKGGAAFFSYLKQPKVIERLEAEGFERAGPGAPHPWYLRLEPGVVPPGEKALCRALTGAQRARIEANRIVALERRRRRPCVARVAGVEA